MFGNDYQYDAGREYGGILERFTTALVDLEEARQKIKELHREIKEYKDLKKLKSVLPFVIKMKDEKVAAEIEIERLNGELKERDTCLNVANCRVDELESEIITLSDEKYKLIDDKSNLASEVDRLKCELEKRDTCLNVANCRVDELESEIITLSDEKDSLIDEVERLNIELKERDTCLNVTNCRVDELEDKIVTLSDKKQNLTDESSNLASKVDQLHSEIGQLHLETEHLRSLRHAKVIVPSKQDPLSSLRSVYVDKQVGECFDFGRYPQGPNGESNPITWRILSRDSNGLLVISEKGLDTKPYNRELVDITCWSDCTLRSWLNDEFYKKAFNEQEQSLIKKTMLANNAGPSTEDNVFLLSVDETESLFASENDRCCKPTEYAAENGASQYNDNDNDVVYKGNTWWWLRSRGNYDDSAALVNGDGSIIDYNYVYDDYGSIRPAFQLAI